MVLQAVSSLKEFIHYCNSYSPMKKECPEFVRNLSKKLTVQIPDISIVRKVFQKMIVSGCCNLPGNHPEFVQVRNLSGKLICDHFLEHFPDNGNVRNLYS